MMILYRTRNYTTGTIQLFSAFAVTTPSCPGDGPAPAGKVLTGGVPHLPIPAAGKRLTHGTPTKLITGGIVSAGKILTGIPPTLVFPTPCQQGGQPQVGPG
jgi:hypothetical protein